MKFKITIILLLIFFNYILADENTKITYERCTGVCNKNFCKMNASCRPFNRTSKSKKLDIYFHESVKLEAPIYLEINGYKKFRTQYRPSLLKLKVEVCGQLLLKNHPIFQLYGGDINGTFLDPCPISGHRYQSPKITNTLIGPLIPVGQWRLDFILSKIINGFDEHIFTLSDYFDIKATSAVEF